MERAVILLLIAFTSRLLKGTATESEECYRKSMLLHLRSENAALNGHVINSETTTSAVSCSFQCLKQASCLSINYNTETKRCDVNNADSKTNPDNVITEAGSMLFEIWNDIVDPCYQHECSIFETCYPAAESPMGYNCTMNSYYRDCAEVYDGGQTSSGVYFIQPDGVAIPVQVFCDMEFDGGGWTVIQNRVDGSLNFSRDWEDYKTGFGNANSEYWLGNEVIHKMTNQKQYNLYIDVTDADSIQVWAKFPSFSVSDEASLYTLTIGDQLSGNEIDHMKYHNGVPFSTWDRDNENNNEYNCGEFMESGWWYKQKYIQKGWVLHNVICYKTELNKEFYADCPELKGAKYGIGVDGDEHCLLQTNMKIKPVN
ncbi:ryncolin-4-like [Ptychodera flava]|uniref:ryncolin-4-like n=1 Tax=Ptychodera flava TaxID=63121 RepID=UPI003969C5A8